MSEPSARPPLDPYLVLALAILLPGVGHVAIGQPRRGLVFAFFTLFLGLVTTLLTTPEQSFVGRHAGGLFVWALSIPDAYRRARLAQARFVAQGAGPHGGMSGESSS